MLCFFEHGEQGSGPNFFWACWNRIKIQCSKLIFLVELWCPNTGIQIKILFQTVLPSQAFHEVKNLDLNCIQLMRNSIHWSSQSKNSKCLHWPWWTKFLFKFCPAFSTTRLIFGMTQRIDFTFASFSPNSKKHLLLAVPKDLYLIGKMFWFVICEM